MSRFYLLLLTLLHRDCDGHINADSKRSTLLYANAGDNVTLPCFYPASFTHLSWYKQSAGETPQLIASHYTGVSDSFHNEFKDDPRFRGNPGDGIYHLNISHARPFDSAMYYCGRVEISAMEFYSGTFLVIGDSSRRSFLRQPVSDDVVSVRPGHSVTLDCTVTAASCDGKHSVYWFRSSTAVTGSQPGIVYADRGEAAGGQCGEKMMEESPTTTTTTTHGCVYHLPKKDLTLHDAGTYHCAVASCGEILFGSKGTRVDVVEETGQDGRLSVPIAILTCVGASLVVCFMVIIVLVCILCKMTRRGRCQCGGLQPQSSSLAHTVKHRVCQDEAADRLQYAALSFNHNTTRRQRDREVIVYSAVRRQNVE